MTDNFSWKCPFCSRDTTITNQNYSSNTFSFDDGNKYGTQYILVTSIVCPNPECREYSIHISLHNQKYSGGKYTKYTIDESKRQWRLIPEADVKIFPEMDIGRKGSKDDNLNRK